MPECALPWELAAKAKLKLTERELLDTFANELGLGTPYTIQTHGSEDLLRQNSRGFTEGVK